MNSKLILTVALFVIIAAVGARPADEKSGEKELKTFRIVEPRPLEAQHALRLCLIGDAACEAELKKPDPKVEKARKDYLEEVRQWELRNPEDAAEYAARHPEEVKKEQADRIRLFSDSDSNESKSSSSEEQ